MPATPSQIKSGVFSSINDAIIFSKGAYMQYAKLTLNERQEIIDNVKKELYPLLPEIAKMIVKETCMGNVEDKIKKMELALTKTPGVDDLITEVKTGDYGMTLYELSAYGVICAIGPCTSPVATLINNTISMLAAGNSVIYIPHPRAIDVTQFVTEKISIAIRNVCGIENLVVTMGESSMSITNEIITHPDISMVVSTGGADVLRRVMTCGKKVIGAGPANPVTIVDETADVSKAAVDIVKGASFDNNIMCVSEKSIVAVSSIVDNLINEMKKNGAYYIDNLEDISKLTSTTTTLDSYPNKALEGKSACAILEAAGITHPKDIKLIVVESNKEHPFAILEMKMPLIPIIRVNDFEEAMETALEIEQDYQHTATIHSQNIQRLNFAAKVMQTSVFIKNGSSLAGIGFCGAGDASFTISTTTGEGTTTARHFARRRRCTLTDGFSIR